MNNGDICYSDNGQELEYVSLTSGGHIVLPVYEREDVEDSSYTGEPFVIRNVYSKPPVEKKLKEIAELDAKLAAKRKELSTVSEAIHTFAREEKARLQRIKQHDGLELLDLWLQDKITHFVIAHKYGHISVETKEKALKKGDEYDRDIKLLSLYGSSKGDLKFGINRYSDGSGNYEYAYPFISESEALAYAQHLIQAQIVKAIEDIKINVRDYDALIKNAEELKVHVPEELTANRERIIRSRSEARIKILEDELIKLKGC